MPLQLAAVAPAAARVPLGVFRTALVVGLTLGAAVLLQRSIGDHWLSECIDLDGEQEAGEAPAQLDNGHVCVLAASVPAQRERGLHFLHRYLDDHPYRDDASVARLDAIAREVDSCAERVPKLYYRQRFEAVVEEARLCDDRWHEHEALVMLGRFDEAAPLRVVEDPQGRPALPALSTLIAAARWADAAAAVRAEPTHPEYREHGVYRACVADWFAHLGGEREATARLRALAAEPEHANATTCAPVLSEFEPDRRADWLTRGQKSGYSFAGTLLASGVGVLDYDALELAEKTLLRPDDVGRDAAALWLPMSGELSWQRANQLRLQAVKQTLDNEPAVALDTANRFLALAESLEGHDRELVVRSGFRPITTLVPAIQLYTPTIFDLKLGTDDPSTYLFYGHDRLLVRSLHSIDDVKIGYSEELTKALRVARAGDGDAMRKQLKTRVWSAWRDADVIAVLPYVTTGRTELARELPHLPINGYIYGDRIFRNALLAFGRRELLEAVGATEDAARWDATYRRFDRVFRDRTRLVALILAEG